jgi:DNA-binding MarR family transcriptional regulator
MSILYTKIFVGVRLISFRRYYELFPCRELSTFYDMIILSKSKSLEEHFIDVKSKMERNKIISLAYLEDGYSQIEIANYLGLSKSAVSLIIKKLGSGDLTAGM